MTEYDLTRRDALIALGAGGVAIGGGALSWSHLTDESSTQEPVPEHHRDTLVALAEVIYPSEVTGIESFVEQYVVGKARARPEYADGMIDALAELDEYARTWEQVPFAALDAEARDDLLGEFSVDIADPDPEGRPDERVRYYLVNELQFALYSSPTGGRLVGLENPQGHPGGTESYRRPPSDADQ